MKKLRHRHLVTLLLVTALGAALRFYRLSFQSFWEDELYSWWAGHFADLAAVIRVGVLPDIHPPGYQIFNFFMQRLGADAEFGLRLPSAIAGTAVIPLIFWLGYQLYSAEEGLIAAALLAVLHFPIYYSQEARAYALVLLFVLVTAVTYHSFIHKLSIPNGAVFVVSASVLAYLHYYGLLFVVMLGGTAVFQIAHHLKLRSRLLIAFGLIALAYLPWLPGLIFQLRFSVRSEWLTTPGSLWSTFLALNYQFFNQRWPQTYLFLGIVLVVGGWWLWGKRRHNHSGIPFPDTATPWLVAWYLLPFLLVYVVSITVTPIFTYRNLIISFPAALLLIARGMTILPWRWGRILVAVGATAVLLGQIVGGTYYTTAHKTQFREAAAAIVNTPSDDSLIIGQIAYPFLLDYYFIRHNLPQRVDFIVETNRICAGERWEERPLRRRTLRPLSVQAFPTIPSCPTISHDFVTQDDPDYMAKLAQLIEERHPAKVWYVHARYDLLIDPDQFIDPDYTLDRRFEFAGIHLYLFETRIAAN